MGYSFLAPKCQVEEATLSSFRLASSSRTFPCEAGKRRVPQKRSRKEQRTTRENH